MSLWDDVREGEELSPLAFPLPVYRLIMAAGSNRDFNSIHHNSEFAKATGAPEIYANNVFLQGMWERLIRARIGQGGTIKSLKGFRMKVFNTAGSTVVVKGKVVKKWQEGQESLVEFEVWSENGDRVTVGPGRVVATMPARRNS